MYFLYLIFIYWGNSGTSNDNRTDIELSDDVGVNSQPNKQRSKASVARAELYRNVQSLALAENGYLGLCQIFLNGFLLYVFFRFTGSKILTV